MEVLKVLVIVVLISTVVINGEEEQTREGRCRKSSGGGGWNNHNRNQPHYRKPYPLHYHPQNSGQRFIGNKPYYPNSISNGEDLSFAHTHNHAQSTATASSSKDEQELPQSNEIHPQAHATPAADSNDGALSFSDAVVADPEDIPSSFGISPRISISPDGKITVARSLKQEKHFHDDATVEHGQHDHANTEEMDVQFHKIRTARSATNKAGAGPQQLAATLEDMKNNSTLQGSSTASGTGSISTSGSTNINSSGSSGWKNTNTLQGVNVNNGAQSGDHLQLQASGENISAANQGSSSASGTGSIFATGSTTVTSPGSSGWKNTNTLQGVNVNNGAQSGDNLQMHASGENISVANQGSSSASGTGSVSASGSTTISSGNSGWKI